MLPEDRRWAIGITIAIVIFFVLILLAGRVYLTGIDDDYILRKVYKDNSTGEQIEFTMTLWMHRNDSRSTPVQIDPAMFEGVSYAEGRIFLQREYIANDSLVTLELRTVEPLRITIPSVDSSAGQVPSSVSLEIEVMHFKVPSHRPIIVVNPSANATRTTEIYPEDIKPTTIHRGTIEAIEIGEGKEGTYTARVAEEIFSFSGSDDYWEFTVYDSVKDRTEVFNGMALFKVRVRPSMEIGGRRIQMGWTETEFFAIDLVDTPG